MYFFISVSIPLRIAMEVGWGLARMEKKGSTWGGWVATRSHDLPPMEQPVENSYHYSYLQKAFFFYTNMHFLLLYPTQKDPLLSIYNVHHIIVGWTMIITDLLSPSTSLAQSLHLSTNWMEHMIHQYKALLASFTLWYPTPSSLGRGMAVSSRTKGG